MGPIGVKERVAVLLSHFATSPDCICGMENSLARLREAVKPQSRLRRAEGAALDGECAVRAIIIVAATYKGHSALFEALWIAIVATSPFANRSKSCSLKSGPTDDPRGACHRAQKSPATTLYSV